MKNYLPIFIAVNAIFFNLSGSVFASQCPVYFFEYDDQIENRGLNPVKRIFDLIYKNPKNDNIRYELKITGTNSYYMNNVLYERRKKTLTFYGFSRVNGEERIIYYRF